MGRKIRRSRHRQFVMRPVRSSMISHYGWFSAGLLVVKFLGSGDVYAYQPVDRSMWLSLTHSKSKGKWLNRRVIGKIGAAKVEGRSREVIEGYIK